VKKLVVLTFFVISFLGASYPSEQARFSIIFSGDEIGHVSVSELTNGDHTVRDLKTVSDARMLITIHVETEAKVTRNKNGVIIEGIGYRHANRGSEDVHAHTQWVGTHKYKVSRNGKSWVLENHPIDYCIADMYFNEPVGKKQVYSNMYGKNLLIEKNGEGKYRVLTPDDKDSYYTYTNGKLMEVEVSTPIGKVVTRRK
jgi:hypothetical protein